MAEPLVVTPGEVSPEEMLDALNDGQRVVVNTEFLGSEHEVTLRWDGETYYCDTPTRLHKHETEAEMRACLERQGYVEGAAEQDG
ncbi:hypothetical protein [Halapricum salinum]|uniref:DUF8001 domain-containing protein n=1 Tax=Halapricum salinum TaxID=1457250 RepID=A0A4D6HCY3_9EURY|nr:hypothetical protein [Halapricum salinum]QCC51670.1 hypothetical protein DV733_10675 [Halapricum salinum]